MANTIFIVDLHDKENILPIKYAAAVYGQVNSYSKWQNQSDYVSLDWTVVFKFRKEYHNYF